MTTNGKTFPVLARAFSRSCAKRCRPVPERIVISLGSGYRLCKSCYEAAGALFAAERAMRKRARAPSDER